MKRLGIDIGSLYVGAVLMDDATICETVYREHNGDFRRTVEEIIEEEAFSSYDWAGITGSVSLPNFKVIDPILAQVEGLQHIYPGCRNAFAVGGETFSLIRFDDDGGYKEHSVNPPCAAGTGSFLEQQAERMELDVKKLAEIAAALSGKTPSIATRCSVFAKTDIIHAMQEGYSKEAICAGLCEGIARNILDALVKGREILSPVAIIGGVSLNGKIVEEMGRMLGLEVEAPTYSHLSGAVGAAVLGKEKKINLAATEGAGRKERDLRDPLKLSLSSYPDFSEIETRQSGDVEVIFPDGRKPVESPLYLGIDIGSTSTKALLINPGDEIVGGFYTYTEGKPIEAVSRILDTLRETLPGALENCKNASTTGSGRKMIGELFGADLIINEITAHAKAAMFLHPEADTIIEIGGQDSKFTRLRNGDVYYSTMNYVCAAGTGSFIQEQAKRLGITLDQFSEMALGARSPYTSDRCTVYMERDLGMLMSEGFSKETLAAAVLHSVRDNYISKVVGKSRIGDFVVFQGATARNKALVASFEELLEVPIHVSPVCHLTGALGAALLVKEMEPASSRFRTDMGNFTMEEEVCTVCPNACSLKVITTSEGKTGWGMKCGFEYSERKPRKKEPSKPLLRRKEVMKCLYDNRSSSGSRSGTVIGIQDSLYNASYAPLWSNFLSRLGFSIEELPTSRSAMAAGKELVNSDFCTPMIYAHGCVKELLEKSVDYLFYPAVENEENNDQAEYLYKKKTQDAYFCYYSQYLPTIVENLTTLATKDKMISPLLSFINPEAVQKSGANIAEELCARFSDITREEVENAFQAAYTAFTEARLEWKISKPETFNTHESNILILGRPYVMFNDAVNLGIPEKLEEMGANIFWMEEIDLESFEPAYTGKYLERMHWHFGKSILKAVEYACRQTNLFPVFLTCFRCSPDAFLLSYVKDICEHYGKPYLILQLDEHGSDVGYETRIEAGLHAFRNYLHGPREKAAVPEKTVPRNDHLNPGDTVLIPYLDRVTGKFWAACFQHAGYNGLLLEATERTLNTGYKYSSGGECMPLTSIVGGAIDAVRGEALTPEKTYLYLPTSCLACNFPQFPIFADLAFHSAGIGGVKIGLVNSMSPGDILPQSLAIKILESMILGSILHKLYFRVKPYEVVTGDTETAMEKGIEKIEKGIFDGADLKAVLKEIVADFSGIKRDESEGRKPRIGILGDLYVKFNEVVNQQLVSVVEELGGELHVPSLTEYSFHLYDADVRIHNDNPRALKLLKIIEGRYEKIAEELLPDEMEPDFAECVQLLEDYDIRHYLAGETSINIGRALYEIKHGLVDAIIHINPMFCCPGVVTSSIFRKMQKDFGIPIIDIFYDGTGNPNKVLVPHLHYLHSNT